MSHLPIHPTEPWKCIAKFSLGSVTYSVQKVSPTPYLLKAASLKRLLVGGVHIPSTGRGSGISTCSDLAQGSTGGHSFSGTTSQELSLFQPRYPLSAALGHGCSWFSGLQTQTEIYTTGPSVLGPLDMDWIMPQLGRGLSWFSGLPRAKCRPQSP